MTNPINFGGYSCTLQKVKFMKIQVCIFSFLDMNFFLLIQHSKLFPQDGNSKIDQIGLSSLSNHQKCFSRTLFEKHKKSHLNFAILTFSPILVQIRLFVQLLNTVATFLLLVQSIFRSILDPPKEIKSLIQCPKKVPLALNWS